LDAEEGEDGAGEVLGGHGTFDGRFAEGIGGADDATALDATASEGDEAGARPVIASTGGIEFRGSTEFAHQNDEGGVEESALVEIGDEGGEGAVEGGDLAAAGEAGIGEFAGDLLMGIPAGINDGDEAGTGLDETTGEETTGAEPTGAIGLSGGG